MCRCSPGDALVHLRGTGEVISMFERVTQPAAGAAGEREPSADLAACSSLSRLWAPCAGWRQTLFFHMPLFLSVLKRPGALCFTRAQSGLCHSGVSHSCCVSRHRRPGAWRLECPLYLPGPAIGCSDFLPLPPSFVLDRKKIAVDLCPSCSECPDKCLPFWSKQILSWEDIEKAAKRVSGMVQPFNS